MYTCGQTSYAAANYSNSGSYWRYWCRPSSEAKWALAAWLNCCVFRLPDWDALELWLVAYLALVFQIRDPPKFPLASWRSGEACVCSPLLSLLRCRREKRRYSPTVHSIINKYECVKWVCDLVLGVACFTDSGPSLRQPLHRAVKTAADIMVVEWTSFCNASIQLDPMWGTIKVYPVEVEMIFKIGFDCKDSVTVLDLVRLRLSASTNRTCSKTIITILRSCSYITLLVTLTLRPKESYTTNTTTRIAI